MKTALMSAICACLAATATATAADAPKAPEIKTARPTRGEVLRYVTLPGSLKANQQATLFAKVPGYLKSIKVDRGDTVKVGDVLAVIDVPELAAELAQQKALLARAKASAGQYAAEEKAAGVEFKRRSEAQQRAADLVTAQSIDDAQAALDIARAKQTMSKAEQDVASAGIKRMETLLGFSQITAPFNGVVTARYADVGAFIPAATAGSTVQTAAIVTVADFDVVRAQVPVTEVEAALVQKDQPVKVTVEGLAGKTFEGRVSRLSFALDDATRTMLVEADLPNPKRELRPGMYATIKIGVEKHTDVLTVPVEALVMEKANAFVFIHADGKAKKTAVKPGFNDGAKVEISSGLKGDEHVLLVGKMTLADGQAVNAVEASR